ncbi:isoprenoid synthase domain-containing protein [Pisolithus orientalis]|uniref:isoprenoid synthase domain-containing protein n=1 Tax=Pisolithus orientalis TaxID=936130 RepID=UPI00222436FD|nr:isoprenoid synthase domain-containing protein [Pisolithus orientalis]KAI5983940.1 isoprenoid synthase domain-containing protein [Pisolithus orientalis]
MLLPPLSSTTLAMFPPTLRPSSPTKVIIPDLVSHCTFALRSSIHQRRLSAESERWLFRSDNLNESTRHSFRGLKAGKLTAMCYPNAGYPQLRVVSDFLNWLFHLDNLSDDMDNRSITEVANVVMNSLHHPYTYRSNVRLSRMTRSFYRRIIKTASPGACQRFVETLEFFFQAINEQATDRAKSFIPDLESYIALRRDTSGCKPCWALVEYAYDLDIPDKVMNHPLILSLGEATNDLVTWSNDIFSYNVEQSKGHTHNMIDVIMNERGIDLQSAFNFVGDLCKQSIDRFIECRGQLPSWDPKIDRDVAIYVEGLADWIVGSLHWSFDTERYFGRRGHEVKKTRVLKLLPPRKLLSGRAFLLRRSRQTSFSHV